MADIMYQKIDSTHQLSYQTGGLSLYARRDEEGKEFSCFWTPRMPTLEALQKLIGLGYISLHLANCSIELSDRAFETRHWTEAITQIKACSDSVIELINIEAKDRFLALAKPDDDVALCCGIGGPMHDRDFLPAPFLLTAPPSLTPAFAAMRQRLLMR